MKYVCESEIGFCYWMIMNEVSIYRVCYVQDKELVDVTINVDVAFFQCRNL